MNREFRDFCEFYQFYLEEHSSLECRRLHFVGTSLFFIAIGYAFFSQIWLLIPLAAVIGYLLAWTGHFLFEKNRPATFRHPSWSARAGRLMYFQMLAGKLPLK